MNTVTLSFEKPTMKRIRISSSIANFYDRLRQRYDDYKDFGWFSFAPTLFFGMYHWGDYLRVLCTWTPTIFWCGSDIKNLTPLRAWLVRNCRHICENLIEHRELSLYGLYAQIQPMLMDDPDKYRTNYKQSDNPVVYMSYHKGREEEYGYSRFLEIADQVPECEFRIFDGTCSIEEYNTIAQTYQACIRFNTFDGFAETLAKAVLWGQYVYSAIPYPDIDQVIDDESLIASLKKLKNKTEPNISTYWQETLRNRPEV